MKKYPKYKESGNWIREFPSDWGAIKYKFVANIETGSTPPKADNSNYEGGDILFVKPDELNGFTPIVDSKEKITKKALENSRLIKEFSLLTCAIGTIGKFGLAGTDCITNQQINSFTFKTKKINPKFGIYSFIASEDEQWKNSTTNVVAIINKTSQSRIYIPYPPLPEQHSIVQFLDHKTNQIDRFIANRKKQIELLKEQKAAIINKAVTKGINPSAKMKDSGIEWIGEVPEHWSVTKLKFVSKIFGRIGFRGYTINDLVEKGEGAITISPSNMKANEMNFESCTYISWFKYEESPEIKIFNDDVLFVKTGSTYGKVSMVENLQEPATINPQILVFKKIKTNPMFFFHQLRSKLIQAHVKTSVIGGTIPTISQEKIGNYYFLLPNKVEQGLIIEHITNETKIIDELITKYQKQIDLMQEYRTALISQAVTGKIDVRDWKPNTKIMVNG